MSEKFYAVKKGLTPGIYYDWESCKMQVDGFSGAEYKSFKSLSDACKWLDMDDALLSQADMPENNIKQTLESPGTEHPTTDFQQTGDILSSLPKGCATAYVDGSYNALTEAYSYGIVFLYEGKELRMSKSYEKNEFSSMRNVAGEIAGSMEAMKKAVDEGCKKIIIYHDYEGISKWCTGEWKANKEGTKMYKNYYDEVSNILEIEFVKVKAHSNDALNDVADRLAKDALGL